MNTRRSLFCLIALAASIDYTFASDPCVDMTEAIGKNYQRQLDADQMRAVRKADFCSEDYNTASSDKKLQLQASYKLFSGSGSASDQQVTVEQSKVCKGEFGEIWRDKVSSSEALTFSNEAASVITACLNLAANGLRPKVETGNLNKIVFSAHYVAGVVAPLKIKQFGPSTFDGLKCTISKGGAIIKVKDVTDTSQTIQPSDSVILECLRDIKKKEIDGVMRQCVDEDIFSIATAGTVQSIKIPSICVEDIGPTKANVLEAKLDQLEQRYAELQDKLGTKAEAADLEARASSLSKALESKANAASVQMMTDLGSCVGVLEYALPGGFWPVVMVPCDKNGKHQVWKILP